MRSLVVVLAWVAGQATAQTTSGWGHLYPNGATAVKYVQGGVEIIDGVGGATRIGSTFFNPLSGGSAGALATENYALTVGGADLTLGAVRTLAAADIALAAAAALAVGAVAFDKVGSPIAKALGYDEFTMGSTRCTAHYQGWQCDAGVPPVVSSGVCFGATAGPTCYATLQEAFVATSSPEFRGMVARNPRYPSGAPFPVDPPQGGGAVIFDAFQADGRPAYYGLAMSWYKGSNSSCPASIDALNPAWSIPAGASPDADGKCKTGRYNSASAQQAAQRIAAYGDPVSMPDLARHVLQDLGQPIATSAPAVLTGPASLVGSPSVTTLQNADGSTTTRTTTPTTNYAYNTAPNTVTYTTSSSTVTQTCVAAGSCTSTTTTTTTAPSTQPDPESDCAKNPNTLGCSQFGTPPSDSVHSTEKTVAFAEEDLGFGAGSCPAPRSVNIRGWELKLVYQPLCDVAPVIKSALLALAYFGTAMMVVTTVVKGV